MAFRLGIPCVEGLIRNRYTGRTFIEGSTSRQRLAAAKYTPLREVLGGKRVFLVEDSIVRSTTMKVLLDRLRRQGGAREIHVRVACPPIIAPCFYGIDMSRIGELFAPKFLQGGPLTDEVQVAMADKLGADSLHYLPVESIARAIGLGEGHLCRACITGAYPTPCGQRLYEIALSKRTSTAARNPERTSGTRWSLRLRAERCRPPSRRPLCGTGRGRPPGRADACAARNGCDSPGRVPQVAARR